MLLIYVILSMFVILSNHGRHSQRFKRSKGRITNIGRMTRIRNKTMTAMPTAEVDESSQDPSSIAEDVVCGATSMSPDESDDQSNHATYTIPNTR